MHCDQPLCYNLPDLGLVGASDMRELPASYPRATPDDAPALADRVARRLHERSSFRPMASQRMVKEGWQGPGENLFLLIREGTA